MIRIAAVTGLVLAAAGCSDDHHVSVLLGPDETQLSRGFTCIESEAPLIPALDDSMLWRGFIQEQALPLRGRLEFNVVIDFLTVGDGTPSCRGEDIAAWCKARGGCGQVFVEPRYCVPIIIPNVVPGEWVTEDGRNQFRIDALRAVYDQLGTAGDVTANAPDGTVIVRAVATTQSCAVLTAPITADHYAAFDNSETSTSLMGCAYSCPVVLDAVESAIELSLDGTDSRCEPQVRACAGDLRAVSTLGD